MHPNRHPARLSTLGALLLSATLGLASPALYAQQNGSIIAAINNQARLVQTAAQRDFSQFVQQRTADRNATMPAGFPLDVNDLQDLKDAKLAYGFPVYTVDPQDMLAGRSDLRSMAKPSGEWRYVITLNNRPIGMAMVEQQNGRWEVTGYGAAVLAKDVDATMAVHANAAHSNARFVRIYQARADFLEVQSASDGQTRFAPLHSARESLMLQERNEKQGVAPAKDALMDGADLIGPLREAVKANVASFR